MRHWIFLIVLSLITVTAGQSWSTNLTFNPDNFDREVGDQISTQILINDASNLATVSLVFSMDNARLALTAADVGPFFNGHDTFLNWVYYEDSGLLEVGITASDVGFGEPGLNGDGVLVTLHFNVLACGDTDFIFDDDQTLYIDPDFNFIFFDTLGMATISVAGGAPSLDPITPVSFNEDTPGTVALNTFLDDPYGPPNSQSWQITNSDHITGTVDDENLLILTPQENWHGTEELTVEVTNLCGESDQSTVTVTVNPLDDPPVLGDIPNVIFDEDGQNTSLVLTNYVTDIDSPLDELIWSVSGGTHVHPVIQAGAQVLITADDDWNGVETITFSVASSSSGPTDSDDVTVTVSPVNDPPQMDPLPNINFNEDAFDNSLDLDEYVSDIDDELAQLSWSASGQTNVEVAISPGTHQVTFSAALNWFGSETITFEVSDSGNLTASETMTVTVEPVNDPPVIEPELPDIAFQEDTVDSSLNLSNFAIDPEQASEDLEWQVSGNENLTIVIRPDLQVIMSAPEDWNGTELLTFTVSDDDGASDADNLVVTVLAQDDSFVLLNIPNVTFLEDESEAAYDLDDYVIDPDNPNPSIIWSVSNHPHVDTEVDGEHIITYSATPNWYGIANLLISADDGQGTVRTDSVRVTVQPVNDPPQPFALIAPDNADTVQTAYPTFIWHAAPDVDMDDVLEYTLELALSADFNPPLETIDLADTTYTATGALDFDTVYFWRVTATDEAGESAVSEAVWSFTPVDPLGVTLHAFNADPTTEQITLNWNFDADGHFAGFHVERQADGANWQRLTAQPLVGNGHLAFTDHDIQPDTSYRYRLLEVDSAGHEVVVGSLAVQTPAASLWRLEQNYPNPFTTRTEIRFSLPTSGAVTLNIYNAAGHFVRSLSRAETMIGGAHSVYWDGRDQQGQRVAAGVYYYQLRLGERTETRRLTLVR